jgi:hypothetical protein
MKKNTFLTILLSLFLVGGMFAQETVWVSATGAGATNGTSEADAFGNFSDALAQINTTGDILRVVGTVPAAGQSLNAKNFQYTIEGDAGGSTLTGQTPRQQLDLNELLMSTNFYLCNKFQIKYK